MSEAGYSLSSASYVLNVVDVVDAQGTQIYKLGHVSRLGSASFDTLHEEDLALRTYFLQPGILIDLTVNRNCRLFQNLVNSWPTPIQRLDQTAKRIAVHFELALAVGMRKQVVGEYYLGQNCKPIMSDSGQIS